MTPADPSQTDPTPTPTPTVDSALQAFTAAENALDAADGVQAKSQSAFDAAKANLGAATAADGDAVAVYNAAIQGAIAALTAAVRPVPEPPPAA